MPAPAAWRSGAASRCSPPATRSASPGCRSTADIFPADGTPPVFLGLDDGAPRFAREIPDWDAAAPPAARPFLDEARERHPSLPESFRFGDLRAVMAELGPADAAHAAAAKGLFAWHATHGFCANCGARSAVTEAGWRRSCPACGAQHFPRTDPW